MGVEYRRCVHAAVLRLVGTGLLWCLASCCRRARVVRGQFRVGSAWSAATQMVEGPGGWRITAREGEGRRKNRDEGAAATGLHLYHIRLCIFMYYEKQETGSPRGEVYLCTTILGYVGVPCSLFVMFQVVRCTGHLTNQTRCVDVPALLFAIFYVVSHRERSENEIL